MTKGPKDKKKLEKINVDKFDQSRRQQAPLDDEPENKAEGEEILEGEVDNEIIEKTPESRFPTTTADQPEEPGLLTGENEFHENEETYTGKKTGR